MHVADIFVDTNVLLYLHDRRDPDKRGICLDWMQAMSDVECAHVNIQVLNELTHVLLRKKWFVLESEVYAVVDAFSALGSHPIRAVEVERARSIRLSTRYSWWDCLLLASALELGCSHFLSEDLQDGQTIAGLTIMDPFAHSPDEILLSP